MWGDSAEGGPRSDGPLPALAQQTVKSQHEIMAAIDAVTTIEEASQPLHGPEVAPAVLPLVVLLGKDHRDEPDDRLPVGAPLCQPNGAPPAASGTT